MNDPSELFATNAITRKQVAEELNDLLFDVYDGEPQKHVSLLEDDDPRLTAEVCAKFAADYGEIDPELSEEDFEEALWLARVAALKAIGLIS